MKRYAFLIIFIMYPVFAWGHGDVSKLPHSAQILQYQMLLYMNPGDVVTRNKLALACIASGKFDEAERELKVVLESDPTNFDALDEMGLLLLKKGDVEGASKYFSKAMSVKTDDMMVHVHMYEALSRLGKSDEAERELDKAKELAKGGDAAKSIQDEIAFLRGKLSRSVMDSK